MVVEYDPRWPELFAKLRSQVGAALGGLAVSIEHVGSTAVPGMPAKPVIDMDVVIPSAADLPAMIERLATLGYVHQGDLGIPGREAFEPPPDTPPHHLYVCPLGGEEYRRHLLFRDHLRAHPDAARAYGDLKRDAARRFREDRESYTEAKSAFVAEILHRAQYPDFRTEPEFRHQPPRGHDGIL
jgi:GrpB-like predicted nucleotidyltransferase (UPF0157 family)